MPLWSKRRKRSSQVAAPGSKESAQLLPRKSKEGNLLLPIPSKDSGRASRRPSKETAKVSPRGSKDVSRVPSGSQATIQSTPSDYKKISDVISEKVLSYVKDSSGWKEIKSGKNVSVSVKPSEDYSGMIYRVEALMDVPVDKLFPFVYLPEFRGKWDKGLQSYKIVETIDKDTFIIHSITHSYGLGLVSPRDFVIILHVKTYDGDFMTTNSVSVEHPDCPATSLYVRGNSYPCGYACYPVPGNPNQSKFVAILQVDLGGMLRPSVIDSVMPNSLINLITDCRAGLKTLKQNTS